MSSLDLSSSGNVSEDKRDILVLGELNVDLLLYGDVTPAFGQAEKLIDDSVLTVGSSSAIFACQAARLGLGVVFAGVVGKDRFGEFMVDSLRESGVDTSAVTMDPALKTGLTVHLVRGQDRAMLTYPGAVSALRAETVEPAMLGRVRHVHVGSYYLQEGLQSGLPELFGKARTAGGTTSLDPGWDPKENWDSGLREVLKYTDIFLPNDQEILSLAGTDDVEEAVQLFVDIPTVVAKRGERGATALSGGRLIARRPPPTEVEDTTGAGDSFDAGFLSGLLGDETVDRALEIGCACGALSVGGRGGVEWQPGPIEVQRFLETSVMQKESV